MGWPLGPISTANNYPGTPAPGVGILLTPVVAKINMFVSNQPIYYSLRQVQPGYNPNAGQWGIEQYIPVASGQTIFVSLDRICSGIRVRSAVPNSPAVVVIEMLAADEVPDSGSD